MNLQCFFVISNFDKIRKIFNYLITCFLQSFLKPLKTIRNHIFLPYKQRVIGSNPIAPTKTPQFN